MHYMASQAVCEHDYDHLHGSHLNLQDCMHHPIAFLAEMMETLCTYIKRYVSQMPGNLWKLSSRK
jgi:hypothetical protein